MSPLLPAATGLANCSVDTRTCTDLSYCGTLSVLFSKEGCPIAEDVNQSQLAEDRPPRTPLPSLKSDFHQSACLRLHPGFLERSSVEA